MATQAVILALLRGFHLVAMASLFGTLVSLALVAPAGLREAAADEVEPRERGGCQARPCQAKLRQAGLRQAGLRQAVLRQAGPRQEGLRQAGLRHAGTTATRARHRLVRLAVCSDALAVLLGIGWMLVETATIADTTSVGATFAVLGKVVQDTTFGHLILVRFALLLLAFPLLRGRGWRLASALLLSGAALGMQGFMGHAGATGGSAGAMLLASEALHLLAAGAWLGGLLPLFLLVGALPPRAAAATCHSFTPVGLSAVAAIACTAVIQAWQLIGSLGGLFGTAYGHVALLKLGLFLVLLVLAVINRLVLTDRLRDRGQVVTLRLLRTSIAVEAVLGATVIVVAAFLASGTPATHETPIWPFARQLSLVQLTDPYGRLLVFYAVLPSLVAAALVAVGRWLWRPVFWPALAGLVVSLALAWPRLQPLLTVEAYPTTFVTSPTDFAAGSIMRGKALFAADCASCHGVDGRGDGSLAKTLAILPADLTAPHLWVHTEGDLYWYISHGIEASPGVPAMPGFGKILSSGNRWALIDFLKANNAGYNMRTSGRWNHPTPLPQFDAVCADGSAIDLDDLRGRVVHVIAADASVIPPPAPADINVATIVLSRNGKVKPLGTGCVTVEPSAWNAFAILLGEPADTLAGTQVLADQNLWLRLRWRPGDPGDWNDPRVLDAAIRDIAAHPLAVSAGGGHVHRH